MTQTRGFVIEPSDVALELPAGLSDESTPGDSNRWLAAILFTDIVNSTGQLLAVGDARWKEVLDAHDRLAEHHVSDSGGRIVHGTGDGVLAVFDSSTRAISAALRTIAGARSLGIELRAGLHTGEITQRVGGAIAGIAVHLASRIANQARPGEILVSRTTADLVAGSGIEFDDRGDHRLKGFDTSHRLLSLRRGPTDRSEPAPTNARTDAPASQRTRATCTHRAVLRPLNR